MKEFCRKTIEEKNMSEKKTEVKEDLRIRRTYKLLSDALMSLLEEKPFEEIYVSDICDKAMVHRTTFYKHFEDKYHLFGFCIKELQKEFFERSFIIKGLENPKEFSMEVVRQALHFHASNKKRSMLLMSNFFVTTFHKNVSQGLQAKFEEYRKSGVTSSIPIPVIAEYHTGALMALIRWWFENNMPISEEELLKHIDLMMNVDHYISVPEGIQIKNNS